VALDPGSRLGVYEVTGLIGEGGMGRVYRARDTRLNRDVALKVLPDAFASDPDRLARFTREAQTLAAISHPNIAQIHGLEESNGIRALVMELASGDDLAHRLARGPLPLDEALPIATRITEALEAAHAHGIVHRDLKPANIKVGADGAVKVLDFGLAKAVEANPATATADNSPTITTPAMTQAGMILGTAAYMSPEQARGRVVDKRTDIWAFGCVLYEMLTGRRAFPGDDVTDTIAAVVRAEPAWDALPKATPPSVRRLLRRCLRKSVQDRLPDIGAARLDLIDAATEGPDAAASVAAPVAATATPSRLPWALAAVAGIAALATLGVAMRPSMPVTPPAPELRVEIQTPPSPAPTQFALSPDGTKLVAVAVINGQRGLWLRSLTDGSARSLPRTAGAQTPFWSPDSGSVAFVVPGKPLQVLRLTDETVTEAGDRVNMLGRGGAWSPGGELLWAGAGVWPLLRTTLAPGAPAVEATALGDGQTSHSNPVFLADGRHFVFRAPGIGAARATYLGSLDALPVTTILRDAGSHAVSREHLLFVRNGKVWGQRLDQTTWQPVGEAIEVLSGTDAQEIELGAGLSASTTGTIAVRGDSSPAAQQLLWLDRRGNDVGRIPDASGALNPDISPDGQRIAVTRTAPSRVWTYEVSRGVWTLSSPGGSAAIHSMWAPDGQRVVYYSIRDGVAGFYAKTWNRDDERLLLAGVPLASPRGLTPDGRQLLFERADDSADLWILLLGDGQAPRPLTRTPFTEDDGEFSFDGRWVAYRSNESGRDEVYVQPFDRAGERVQVSNGGGAQPRWRRDGRELFYVALDNRLMAVPLAPSTDGRTLSVGAPVALFATRIAGGAIQQGGRKQQYDVSNDGQRFLVVSEPEGAATTPITLIVNWQPKTPATVR